MIRFEYDTSDTSTPDFPSNRVLLEWEGEEENIDDMLTKFKYFLAGMSYPENTINKIRFLSNEQLAKLRLLGDEN